MPPPAPPCSAAPRDWSRRRPARRCARILEQVRADGDAALRALEPASRRRGPRRLRSQPGGIRRGHRVPARAAGRGSGRRRGPHRSLAPRGRRSALPARHRGGRALRTRVAADPPCRALRSRRQRSPALDRADARHTGATGRLSGNRAVHATAQGRQRRSRRAAGGAQLRHRTGVPARRRAGDRGDGDRHGKHSALRQIVRARQCLCHRGQAPGRRS